MKGPASHYRHIKSKKQFNDGKAQLEAQRKMVRHESKKRKVEG